MPIDQIHRRIDEHVTSRSYHTLLDVGGWFIPYPRATHVIDFMPWETRGCKVQLEQLTDERFSKQTWFCIDLCDPQSPFPFPDKSIDFVMCSGTLEDLADPQHCANEMARVGRAGYIRVPSMLSELTIGIQDRTNNVVGYHHHKWICRQDRKQELTMMAKIDARLSRVRGEYVPHRTAERLFNLQFERDIHFFWDGHYTVSYEAGPSVRDRILIYLDDLQISRSEYIIDSAKRLARNGRDFVMRRGSFAPRNMPWWGEMLAISRPFSDPALWIKAGGRVNS